MFEKQRGLESETVSGGFFKFMAKWLNCFMVKLFLDNAQSPL
jgi:hypothetical protein